MAHNFFIRSKPCPVCGEWREGEGINNAQKEALIREIVKKDLTRDQLERLYAVMSLQRTFK